MRTTGSVVIAAALLAISALPSRGAEEGVALAIVYDTSGSMHEAVPDRAGKRAPKYVIANRALTGIANQLEAFAKSSEGKSVKMHTALFTFESQGAKAALPLGPFDASRLKEWASNFRTPRGDTPLGNAVKAAGECVMGSPLSRKHVLVITDGMNTAGPAPTATMPALRERATREQADLSVHFVAFDVDAKVFSGVKKLGATVVGAADETQLNAQLQYILRKKILLEEEEEPAERK